ncbi:hypothetical protein BJ546DRAFT_17866 [Cryomyces antarcticus]
MSSSIAIPRRKQPLGQRGSGNDASSSSSFSSSSSSPQTPSPSPMPSGRSYDRRPSLLGSSLSKAEHTVINVGHPDGPPRLITCVKASQGFDWNQDIFLPSRADYESSNLERKQDPVEDIILTDEEAAAILPQ